MVNIVQWLAIAYTCVNSFTIQVLTATNLYLILFKDKLKLDYFRYYKEVNTFTRNSNSDIDDYTDKAGLMYRN